MFVGYRYLLARSDQVLFSTLSFGAEQSEWLRLDLTFVRIR